MMIEEYSRDEQMIFDKWVRNHPRFNVRLNNYHKHKINLGGLRSAAWNASTSFNEFLWQQLAKCNASLKDASDCFDSLGYAMKDMATFYENMEPKLEDNEELDKYLSSFTINKS